MNFFPARGSSRHDPESATSSKIVNPQPTKDATVRLPGEVGSPVSLPTCRIVADELFFALDQFLVFSNGFFTTFRILQRESFQDSDVRQILKSFTPIPENLYSERTLWGLEFDDSRRAYANAGYQWNPGGEAASEDDWEDHVESDFDIVLRGASGSAEMVRLSYWVNAVPRSTMTLHLSRPDSGEDESNITVNADPIFEASQPTAHLWPKP